MVRCRFVAMLFEWFMPLFPFFRCRQCLLIFFLSLSFPLSFVHAMSFFISCFFPVRIEYATCKAIMEGVKDTPAPLSSTIVIEGTFLFSTLMRCPPPRRV